MTKYENIAVLGTGSWGSALGVTLAQSLNDAVLIWGRDKAAVVEINSNHTNQKYLEEISFPKNLIATNDLDFVVEQAKDLLIVVPSHVFAKFLHKLKPLLKSYHRVVYATKGLDAKTGKFLHEVLEDILGDKISYAILSGPSFAQEVALNLPTAVSVAANNDEFANDLVNYFHRDVFRVYKTEDIIGIELGGIVKNILAVAAGISDGLGYGANARAALLTRGLRELLRLGEKLNISQDTLIGLAGIGDIILTCTDNKSRNRRFGLYLAEGMSISKAQEKVGQVVEALYNAKLLDSLANKNNIEMPIVASVLDVLEGRKAPREVVYGLISRKPTNE